MWGLLRSNLAGALLALFLSTSWLVYVAPVSAAEFFSEVADLPLAPAMLELPSETLVFDKPEGRIVESFAEGPASVEEVLGFYEGTLPQLGWDAVGDGRYERGDESLLIEAGEGETGTLLHIVLSPK